MTVSSTKRARTKKVNKTFVVLFCSLSKKVKALNIEIRDLQQEFEDDRTDYLDTIRKQDKQLILLQQILERVQPTIRKDSNYCNIEKIKEEAIWNDETQRWRIPDLVISKTKLPPAGINLLLVRTYKKY